MELIKMGMKAKAAQDSVNKVFRKGRPSREVDPREKILGVRPL